MDNVKVALVHDWLTGRRGGEKVLEVLSELFPDASLFTLVHFPGTQIKELEQKQIITSFIQKMPFLKTKYRSYLPLYPIASELFDLQDYDLIISSSHCVAKGIIPRPDALHISYVHSPMRYAWNQYFSYFSAHRLNVFSRLLIPPIMHWLRIWDESSSQRVDHFIANSKTVAQRIRKYYGRNSDVINPPVNTDFFQPGSQTKDYYLIVSALVPYKRIDLAVEAFNRTGDILYIVGTGPDRKKLKKKARDNIHFLGKVSAEDLLRVYQQAKALIIPGEEDFGINSLEAQSCGVPVIAFGRGGATETVIPGSTGLFFRQLNVKSLMSALDKFKKLTFNKTEIRKNTIGYSRVRFKKRISSFIQEKWNDHREKNKS
ncbi:MAG: glycosyltransferase [Candidatus Aminicenantes bacterium]|nr:glycosyltransferase [Candidatus Aminicenantes bacterium]